MPWLLGHPARAALLLAFLGGCDQANPYTVTAPLVINEVVSNNDGAWIDEYGETDDYIEIANVSKHAIDLGHYALSDSSGARSRLPNEVLAPGKLLVLWADASPEQGSRHLHFKLDSEGERLTLEDGYGDAVDAVEIPGLALSVAYARQPSGSGEFAVCRYASPERENGTTCGPPPPPEPPPDFRFQRYTWPEPWPELRGPLVLSELALKPSGPTDPPAFIEVQNVSDAPVQLTDYAVRIAAHAPGIPWPSATEGVLLPWPETASLLPGERVVVPVDDAARAAITADAAFEGVVTLFGGAAFEVIDRVDFMHWPEGAGLTRVPDASGRLRFCAALTPGEDNEPCDALASRPIGDRLRHLYTPGDFAALAEGETNLAIQGVKFVIDLGAGDVVHLLRNREWALHYTFVRERIENLAPLDRCDEADARAFNQGWWAFSQAQYDQIEERRYLLGTLDRHAGSALRTVDFAIGDAIIGTQMRHAFFTVAAHVDEPTSWALRPSEPRQVAALRTIDGSAPIVGQNAPFEGVQYQPLTAAIGYGVLRYVAAADLAAAALSHDTIVVTDDVPNEIPPLGGLMTEAFQTPLAHVNILSKNRGTPNMALTDAREHPDVKPYFGKLVRLEVSAGGFTLEEATAKEADAFFEARKPQGPKLKPRLDLSVRGVQPLEERGLDDLPSIGAKAAQLAELDRLDASRCGAPLPTPLGSFAIPLVHYWEHFERSGARALLDAALADPDFRTNPQLREDRLLLVQNAIREEPLDANLLREVQEAVKRRMGEQRLRIRSSSNTEDLPQFSGAGLYTSASAALHDAERPIEGAILTVWASLWSLRAYDERELGNVDQSQVAMGILVTTGFLSERANAVAISRDLLDPTRSEIDFINVQMGEASVTNPSPGVVTEQIRFFRRRNPDTPEFETLSKSSLARGADVLTVEEMREISCYMRAIHNHLQQRLDPEHANRWFAVDLELKLTTEERRLVIKQARPYSFGKAEIPADCRET